MDGNRVYGLDLRSIGLFRVALGIFLLGELVFRVLLNFSEIYSPESGVLGNCFREGYASVYELPPFIFGIESDAGMLAYLTVYAACLLLFILGIVPRTSAFVSAVLFWLVNSRYNVLYLGWEMYASTLLFWAIILPVGDRFAVLPRPMFSRSNLAQEWRSPLAFAALFQIAFIYFYNGISKNGERWMNGEAVHFFLSEYDKLRPLAESVQPLDGLLRAMTYGTLIFEVILPVMIFLPYRNVALRVFALLGVLAFHWGIDLLVDVGNFKYVATCAVMLMVPGDIWDKVLPVLPTRTVRPFFASYRPSLAKAEVVLAIVLVGVVILSNLNQTAKTPTEDRVKHLLSRSGLDGTLQQWGISSWPQYSFFSQYWHLYSPDPPREKGYLQVEVLRTDDVSVRIWNGEPLDDRLFISKVHQNLMQYLLLKGGRNKKDQLAEHCLLMTNLRRWNSLHRDVPIKGIQLVAYSFRPSSVSQVTTKPSFERVEVKTYDVRYKAEQAQ